jgi:hypothetical protein
MSFDPSEPRDEHGQWTSDGGSSDSKDDSTSSPADRVRQLGSAWVDQHLANDPVFKEIHSRVEALDHRIAELQPWTQKAVEPILQANDRIMSSKTAETRTAYQQAVEKVQNVFALQEARFSLQTQASQRIADKLNEGKQPQQIVADNRYRDKEVMNGYVRDFSALGGIKNPGSLAIRNLSSGEVQRSYFDGKNTIYFERNTDPASAFHEMGHWLENNMPGGKSAASSFLESRTRGEMPVRDPTMKNYDKREMMVEDKFRDPYIGKLYPKTGRVRMATEITSMGMQYLRSDATKFFHEDRDHFNFTIGMLRAARMGGIK